MSTEFQTPKKSRVRKNSEPLPVPDAPKKPKYVKPSSLIPEEKELIRKLFEEVEKFPKDKVIILEGVVDRVYTDNSKYGAALVFTIPVGSLVGSLIPSSAGIINLPEREPPILVPWKLTGDGNYTMSLGISAKSPYSFSDIFQSLKDETAEYGYGKKGSTVRVYVRVSTYKGVPNKDSVGISIKLIAPIVMEKEAQADPEGMSSEEDPDELRLAPSSCKSPCIEPPSDLYDFRREEGGVSFAEAMEEQDHLAYLLGLPTIHHHDGDIHFYCE